MVSSFNFIYFMEYSDTGVLSDRSLLSFNTKTFNIEKAINSNFEEESIEQI